MIFIDNREKSLRIAENPWFRALHKSRRPRQRKRAALIQRGP
jgi:hypothetical protein